MTDVFLSYSRRDQEFVRRLHDALEERGRDVWVDWEGIPATAEWMAEVRRAIDAADSFVFVISPDSVASPVCRDEVSIAVEGNKRLIPLVRREVPDADVPERIRAHNWIFFREGDDFEGSIERLTEALETDLDWVHAHTRLLVRATEWDQRRRDRSLLLRGTDLVDAEGEIAAAGERQPRPTQLQTEYVFESRRAATRRQRTMVGAVSIALVVAIALSVFALVQRGRAVRQGQAAERARAVAVRQRKLAEDARAKAVREARSAKSGELSAEAITLLPSDPELGLLLARAAGQLDATAQSAEALRQALLRSNLTAVLRGHTDAVYRAELSPDGREVLTGSWDDTARLFDARTGEQIATMQCGADVYAIAWSPDGSLVATGTGTSVKVWSAADGSLVSTLAGAADVLAIEFAPGGDRVVLPSGVWDARSGRKLAAFGPNGADGGVVDVSPDGRLAVTAPGYFVPGAGHILTSSDTAVRVFDLASGRTVASLPQPDPVSVAFSPDGRRIVVTDQRARATVWDVARRKVLATMTLRSSALAARWSSDGSRIVTAEYAGRSDVWDAGTGRHLSTLTGHGGPVLDASFSPNGRFVVTASVDHTARVWEAATGRQVFVLNGHTNWVFDASFGPDGKSVLTASWDHTARIWDVESPSRGLTLQTAGGPVTSVVFAPDGESLATGSGQESSYVRLWDTVTGRVIHKLCCHLGPQVLAFSPDGRLLAAAAGRMEGGTTTWDLRTGTQTSDVRPQGSIGFNDVSFGPDGAMLTAGSSGVAQEWDARTGRLLRTFGRPPKGSFLSIQSARFSPDGREVLTYDSNGLLRLYRESSGAPVRTVDTGLHDEFGAAASFSPDGRWMVAGGDERAGVWDVATGDLLAMLRHPAPGKKYRYLRTVKAAFDPAAPVLATAAGDTIRLWSLPGGNLLATLEGHTDYVSSIAFSPDGRYLVSGGWDQTARVWQVPSGRPLAVLRGQGAQIDGVAFNPDGRLVAAASEDGTARIYPQEAFLPYRDLEALAERSATRELTQDERKRYLGSFARLVR
jgi:WD40 repeat protein